MRYDERIRTTVCVDSAELFDAVALHAERICRRTLSARMLLVEIAGGGEVRRREFVWPDMI